MFRDDGPLAQDDNVNTAEDAAVTVNVLANAPLASTYFNMRKTTIYGGSNEVQRNIVAQTVLG